MEWKCWRIFEGEFGKNFGVIWWMVDEVHVGFMCFEEIPGGFSLLKGYETCN